MKLSYVLDTSVIVTALRSSKGSSRQLLLEALRGTFELLLSVPLILEYEAVLTRPANLSAFGLSVSEVTRILDDLVAVSKPVRLVFRWRPVLVDANDDMILETAIHGNATSIVTFNQRHFVGVEPSFGCSVILPSKALERIRSV